MTIRLLNQCMQVVLVGAAILLSPRPAFAQDGLPRLRLVEDLRLDADVEDFSLVGRVIVGRNGVVAVPLPQDMEIRLYDHEGRRIAAIGRSGSGPGEFRHLGAMTWIGDTLVVDDQRQSRVTYVTRDGTLVGTRRLPSPLARTRFGRAAQDSAFRFFVVHAASPGGTVLGVAALTVGVGPAQAAPFPRVLLSLSPDGSARVLADPPQYTDERWSITIGGLSNPIPFAFQPQIVFSSGGRRFGFLTADQSRREGTYSIAVFGTDGDTLFSRRYPFRGEPIPSSAIDSAIAAMAPRPEQRESSSDPTRFQVAARERIPAVHAPVERMVLALDSTTWLALRPTMGRAEAIVLDARGTPVASVELPPRSRIQQVTESHLWVTETDTFDLASVVRYRIIRP